MLKANVTHGTGDGAMVSGETITGAESGQVMSPPSKEIWPTYLQALVSGVTWIKFNCTSASFLHAWSLTCHLDSEDCYNRFEDHDKN